MKQFYLPTIIALFTLIIYSCANDTELTPDDNPPSVYETAEEAFSAANSLYRTGVMAFYGDPSLREGVPAMLGGYLSGFFVREIGAETALYESARRLALNDATMVEHTNNIRHRALEAINQSNELITNLSGAQGLTNEEREQLVGEAHFFRAFNYFHLARWFSNVPLATEGNLSVNTPRGELSDVYDLIIGDLQRAIVRLPDEPFSRNEFRVSRLTAQTLLADVYLTMSGYPLQQNRFREAATTARQIINSNKHSLADNGVTSGTSAFNQLRTQADNAEHIFGFRNEHASRSLASFSLSGDAANWGVVRLNTANIYMPTQAFLNIYDSQNDMRVQEQQFFHTFVRYEKSGRTIIQTFSLKPFWWFNREALFETGAASNHIVPIYRYAEVLLIAAEAIAMAEGVTNETVGYLTAVRARAWRNIERETIQAQLASLSREQFIEEVWAERLREFPLEMKIWTDIQRTRKFPVTNPNNRGRVEFSDVVETTNSLGVPFEMNCLVW